ncbi:hepatoma-derived growth factor-related protein 2-like [Teleopsis dalmanni]|uniref:hepatoma-derived growth factor-related protein 2-like n=1 Tax=Teleopsis dalmanni TaxID=139649 RepID=UPI0018CE4E12|nr:hepatoma-derived growth factor-related protein 2-like [Teleopsis dalmanni]
MSPKSGKRGKRGYSKKNATCGTSFKLGEFIFAKVRGFPYWPAKIFRILTQRTVKFRVYFYGTDQIADLGSGSIKYYSEETKQKCITKRLLKNKKFVKALSEIENAMIDEASDIAPNALRYLVNENGKEESHSVVTETKELLTNDKEIDAVMGVNSIHPSYSDLEGSNDSDNTKYAFSMKSGTLCPHICASSDDDGNKIYANINQSERPDERYQLKDTDSLVQKSDNINGCYSVFTL